MLGPLSLDPQQANSAASQQSLGIALQARIWWYHSTQGIAIDRAAYEAHHRAGGSGGGSANEDAHGDAEGASRPDRAIVARLEDIQRRMAATAEAEAGDGQFAAVPAHPAWQSGDRIPKVDLSKKADDGAEGAGGGGGEGADGADAPYPAHFQAIFAAVRSGEPVPGVRDIPNTVVRHPVGVDPRTFLEPPPGPPDACCSDLILTLHGAASQQGLSPVGKMRMPRKPWETRAVVPNGRGHTDEAGLESFLDDEFQPVDETSGRTARAGDVQAEVA